MFVQIVSIYSTQICPMKRDLLNVKLVNVIRGFRMGRIKVTFQAAESYRLRSDWSRLRARFGECLNYWGVGYTEILVRAKCMCCPWALQTKHSFSFFSFSLLGLLFSQKGSSQGLWNFALGFKNLREGSTL